jgi:hypothetical protein
VFYKKNSPTVNCSLLAALKQSSIYRQGLFLLLSDLDVVLMDSSTVFGKNVLNDIRDAIKDAGICSKIEVIAFAKAFFVNSGANY